MHTHTAAAAKSLQSCPTLCDPRDGSPPGSPIPGIRQVRTLEWVAIFFSNECMYSNTKCQVQDSDYSWLEKGNEKGKNRERALTKFIVFPCIS